MKEYRFTKYRADNGGAVHVNIGVQLGISAAEVRIQAANMFAMIELEDNVKLVEREQPTRVPTV